VAVIGSVYASLYATRLTAALPVALPATVTRTAHASVGAALTTAQRLAAAGHPKLASGVHDAAEAAFFHGFHAANYVAAGVAAAGALMALALLPAYPTTSGDAAAEPHRTVPSSTPPRVVDPTATGAPTR
jgi:hypothetical protein